MPRPSRYSYDELLDAAADLLAADGPAAVAMSAVARAVGAPSGSVYYRFPTRAALCGELWIRTEERFQRGFLGALHAPGDVTERCVAAALFTVQWCRERPYEAQVLLVGAEALGRPEWPAAVTERRAGLREAFDRSVATLEADRDRLHAALVDVPYGIVRRYLVARKAIPRSADDIVADCVRALVA